MDKKQFIDSVNAQAPEEVKSFIPVAVKIMDLFIFHERVGYQSYDRPKVIQTAGLLKNQIEKIEDMSKQTESEPTPREYLSEKYLVGLIVPWVQDIRQALFHSKSAPFSRIEDAETWWNEAKKRTDEWSKGVDEWCKRVDEWYKIRDEWEAHWQAMLVKYPLLDKSIKTWAALKKQGVPVDLPTRQEREGLNEIKLSLQSLEVGEPPEQDEQVKVLKALVRKILKIYKVTPFTVGSMKMYILADVPPVVPTFTFRILKETHSLPSGTSFLDRFAIVTIRDELTFEDLRSLCRSIRRELGIEGSRSPTPKHLALYEMVKEKGTILSGKGTVASWKSLKDEWNKNYPGQQYKEWRCAKIAYDRLCQKMNDRFLGNNRKEAIENHY